MTTTAAAAAPSVALDFSVTKKGSGYIGTIYVPLTNGKVLKATSPRTSDGSVSSGRRQALGKAAALVDKITSNPALQALLPPQAAIALKATKALAKADAVGKFADVAAKFTGPAIDRLKSLFG